MIELRGGHQTSDRRLDRLPSATDEHLKLFPLRATDLRDLAAAPRPMAIGVNWYSNFWTPRNSSGVAWSPYTSASGPWWIGLDSYGKPTSNLGSIQGGHCVCLKQRYASDDTGWWSYYDQGQEGRCVQFGVSRMQTLLNRKRYEIRESVPLGRWLYYEAQKIDEWSGGSYPGASPVYEGTSVRAALAVILNRGLVNYRGSSPTLAEGISAYRWANDYNDVKAALGYSDKNYVDILNSWGRYGYPHLVRMSDDVGARLLSEDGEFGVVTDR